MSGEGRGTVRRATPEPGRGHDGVCRSLQRRTHAGRYFGGLWFKVFRERGPS
jgi:hypothetical protein